MDDDIREALPGMFTDKRFRRTEGYIWRALINDKKVLTVVGTRGPQFTTNYALGEERGFDRVAGAKKKNKIDAACVVFADVNDFGAYTFVKGFDAIEIEPKLKAVPTRTSAYGTYWLISPSLVEADFDPDAQWM